MFPAGVDAWLGKKAQIKTGCQGDRSQAPAPSTFLEGAPKLLCSSSPLHPILVLWSLHSPLQCLAPLCQNPLKFDFPLRSSLPFSPLPCKQLMSPGHECLLERWAHVLSPIYSTCVSPSPLTLRCLPPPEPLSTLLIISSLVLSTLVITLPLSVLIFSLRLCALQPDLDLQHL